MSNRITIQHKKISIDGNELSNYCREYRQYARQDVKGASLKLLINFNGHIKVIHGTKTIYEGSSKKKAIAAWEAVQYA